MVNIYFLLKTKLLMITNGGTEKKFRSKIIGNNVMLVNGALQSLCVFMSA